MKVFSVFLLTIFALSIANAQIPEPPTWINDGCLGAVCSLPTEVFDGLRVGQAWYEEGTMGLCPEQSSGQSGCVSVDPDFRAWLELARSNNSKLILVADSTLYGVDTPLNVGIPGDGVWPDWAYGGDFTFGLPPLVLQQPNIPALDSQAYSDWWDAKYQDCLAAGTCGPVTVIPHTHQFTLTMPDGSTFTGTTGSSQ